VLIKLADRLHNMRTLEHLQPDRQYKIAEETLEIYAPIAHRLGMGKIRGELEDLGFRFLDPLGYEQVEKSVNARRKQGEAFLAKMQSIISDKLRPYQPHDYEQVIWQVGANVDPMRDVLLSQGPLDQLDHAPSLQSLGGKLGIDATAKWASEGYPRTWPEVARMSDAVRTRVSERWGELGLAMPPTAGGDGRRRGGLLRRRRT